MSTPPATSTRPFVPDPQWPAIQTSMHAAPDSALNGPVLPAVDLPFPIISPFTVRSDLQKLAPGETIVRRDCEYPVYARARLAALLAGDSDWLLAPQADVAAALDALHEVVECLTADSADRWRLGAAAGLELNPVAGQLALRPLRPDAVGLAEWLTGHCAAEPSRQRRDLQLLATVLALDLQEDLVLMAPTDGSPEVFAEGSFVSFPSGWAPQQKIGQPLSAIHAPVADGQSLRRASTGLSIAMLQKGPFVRHVWTLSDSFALDRHPGRQREPIARHRAAAPDGTDLESMVFRCERQVTLALPRSGRALFLIRVYVAALPVAANSPERRARLVDSLRSMSQAVVDYKNIGVLRERVLSAWG